MQVPYSVPDLVDWQQPINYAHPLNRGLVSWWLATPRGFGSTRWLDLCNRHHGTLTGMDPKTDWVGPLGRPGGWGALTFQEANDEVVTFTTPALNFPVTVSCWVRPESFGENGRFFGSDTSFRLEIGHLTSGQIFVFVGGGTGSNAIFTGVFLSLKIWHRVTLSVAASGSFVLYLDGRSVFTGNGTSTTLGETSWRIGQGGTASSSRRLDGQVDGVEIFDRHLSASEELARNELSRRYYPGLLNRPTFARFAPADAGGGNNELLHVGLMQISQPIQRPQWVAVPY